MFFQEVWQILKTLALIPGLPTLIWNRIKLKKEIKTRSWGDPIDPRLVPSSNGSVIIEPWDPMYDTDEKIDILNLSEKVLPPCSEFSRIWCDKDVWKPVGI